MAARGNHDNGGARNNDDADAAGGGGHDHETGYATAPASPAARVPAGWHRGLWAAAWGSWQPGQSKKRQCGMHGTMGIATTVHAQSSSRRATAGIDAHN